MRHSFLILVVLGGSVGAAAAQGHDHPSASPATSEGWVVTTDANVFVGVNDQERKFTDFTAWESQNWFMAVAEHPFGGGRVALQGMASLEPFTMRGIGSPQVFQSGEAYKGAPLIDYQHPHDLVMGLGATYTITRGRVRYVFGADIVGAPALGPTPFMHRESARDNPQAPLTHHQLDSTHLTPGVLRGGVSAGSLTVEASWFRGAEPDDHRLTLERPRFDSWSARASWQRGPWTAQLSGAKLHEPEVFDPYDLTRLTASVAFDGAVGSRPLSATLAWGENREIHGILDGYLLEWDWRAFSRAAIYGRAEVTARDILDLGGFHPRGVLHVHRLSRVAALTVGLVHDVGEGWRGRFGVGADATVYRHSPNLADSYGAPRSFHAFLRWRPRVAPPSAHVH
ncbi:MAG: hypothetical protein U0Q12_07300 [Vicinamibacterales bacterium]